MAINGLFVSPGSSQSQHPTSPMSESPCTAAFILVLLSCCSGQRVEWYNWTCDRHTSRTDTRGVSVFVSTSWKGDSGGATWPIRGGPDNRTARRADGKEDQCSRMKICVTDKHRNLTRYALACGGSTCRKNPEMHLDVVQEEGAGRRKGFLSLSLGRSRGRPQVPETVMPYQMISLPHLLFTGFKTRAERAFGQWCTGKRRVTAHIIKSTESFSLPY